MKQWQLLFAYLLAFKIAEGKGTLESDEYFEYYEDAEDDVHLDLPDSFHSYLHSKLNKFKDGSSSSSSDQTEVGDGKLNMAEVNEEQDHGQRNVVVSQSHSKDAGPFSRVEAGSQTFNGDSITPFSVTNQKYTEQKDKSTKPIIENQTNSSPSTNYPDKFEIQYISKTNQEPPQFIKHKNKLVHPFGKTAILRNSYVSQPFNESANNFERKIQSDKLMEDNKLQRSSFKFSNLRAQKHDPKKDGAVLTDSQMLETSPNVLLNKTRLKGITKVSTPVEKGAHSQKSNLYDPQKYLESNPGNVNDGKLELNTSIGKSEPLLSRSIQENKLSDFRPGVEEHNSNSVYTFPRSASTGFDSHGKVVMNKSSDTLSDYTREMILEDNLKANVLNYVDQKRNNHTNESLEVELPQPVQENQHPSLRNTTEETSTKLNNNLLRNHITKDSSSHLYTPSREHLDSLNPVGNRYSKLSNNKPWIKPNAPSADSVHDVDAGHQHATHATDSLKLLNKSLTSNQNHTISGLNDPIFYTTAHNSSSAALHPRMNIPLSHFPEKDLPKTHLNVSSKKTNVQKPVFKVNHSFEPSPLIPENKSESTIGINNKFVSLPGNDLTLEEDHYKTSNKNKILNDAIPLNYDGAKQFLTALNFSTSLVKNNGSDSILQNTDPSLSNDNFIPYSKKNDKSIFTTAENNQNQIILKNNVHLGNSTKNKVNEIPYTSPITPTILSDVHYAVNTSALRPMEELIAHLVKVVPNKPIKRRKLKTPRKNTPVNTITFGLGSGIGEADDLLRNSTETTNLQTAENREVNSLDNLNNTTLTTNTINDNEQEKHEEIPTNQTISESNKLGSNNSEVENYEKDKTDVNYQKTDQALTESGNTSLTGNQNLSNESSYRVEENIPQNELELMNSTHKPGDSFLQKIISVEENTNVLPNVFISDGEEANTTHQQTDLHLDQLKDERKGGSQADHMNLEKQPVLLNNTLVSVDDLQPNDSKHALLQHESSSMDNEPDKNVTIEYFPKKDQLTPLTISDHEESENKIYNSTKYIENAFGDVSLQRENLDSSFPNNTENSLLPHLLSKSSTSLITSESKTHVDNEIQNITSTTKQHSDLRSKPTNPKENEKSVRNINIENKIIDLNGDETSPNGNNKNENITTFPTINIQFILLSNNKTNLFPENTTPTRVIALSNNTFNIWNLTIQIPETEVKANLYNGEIKKLSELTEEGLKTNITSKEESSKSHIKQVDEDGGLTIDGNLNNGSHERNESIIQSSNPQDEGKQNKHPKDINSSVGSSREPQQISEPPEKTREDEVALDKIDHENTTVHKKCETEPNQQNKTAFESVDSVEHKETKHKDNIDQHHKDNPLSSDIEGINNGSSEVFSEPNNISQIDVDKNVTLDKVTHPKPETVKDTIKNNTSIIGGINKPTNIHRDDNMSNESKKDCNKQRGNRMNKSDMQDSDEDSSKSTPKKNRDQLSKPTKKRVSKGTSFVSYRPDYDSNSDESYPSIEEYYDDSALDGYLISSSDPLSSKEEGQKLDNSSSLEHQEIPTDASRVDVKSEEERVTEEDETSHEFNQKLIHHKRKSKESSNQEPKLSSTKVKRHKHLKHVIPQTTYEKTLQRKTVRRKKKITTTDKVTSERKVFMKKKSITKSRTLTETTKDESYEK